MNRIIGFFESYTVGFAPSKIPPCGVARLPDVGEGEAEEATLVTVTVKAEAMEDMVGGYGMRIPQ